MRLKHALLPVAALAGSAVFLAKGHFAAEETRETLAVYRETVRTITEHRVKTKTEAAAKEAEKQAKEAAPPARESIDLKELAGLMQGMRGGGMPDLKAMMKLQKTVLEMSPEDLTALIADVKELELPPKEREQLAMMLIQELAQRDPKAAVLAISDYLDGTSGDKQGTSARNLRQVFVAWAKKDVTDALKWYDAELAAGRFESKSLSEVNEQRVEFERAVLENLSAKDPAAVRDRLLVLPEAERVHILKQAHGFDENAEARKIFTALVRETLPVDKQTDALKGMTRKVFEKGNLEGVSGYLAGIEATPEERKAVLPEAAEANVQQRVYGGGEKPDLKNISALRTWLTEQGSDAVDATLGRSLASAHGPNFKREDALALVTELHAAAPSDELIVSFLEQNPHYRSGSDKAPFEVLAAKIENPEQRAAVLQKIADNPK